jgi:hypothetical protein
VEVDSTAGAAAIVGLGTGLVAVGAVVGVLTGLPYNNPKYWVLFVDVGVGSGVLVSDGDGITSNCSGSCLLGVVGYGEGEATIGGEASHPYRHSRHKLNKMVKLRRTVPRILAFTELISTPPPGNPFRGISF